VKQSENGDLSDFERGQIVGVSLAGASVMKTDTLLDVKRATISLHRIEGLTPGQFLVNDFSHSQRSN
jgi:hypothetical protein